MMHLEHVHRKQTACYNFSRAQIFKDLFRNVLVWGLTWILIFVSFSEQSDFSMFVHTGIATEKLYFNTSIKCMLFREIVLQGMAQLESQ